MMKRATKRIIAILLASSACFTALTACKKEDKTPTTNSKVSVSDDIPLTDIDLVKDGKTEYTIVVPFGASDYETYAAQELELYFENASGADIKTVKDSDITADTQSKYLAVGNTTLVEACDVSITQEELGNEGYKIERKNNTVVMAGYGGYGTLFSVYEFLHHAFGFEPYAIDEIYYDIGLQFKLPDFHMTDVPASATRAGTWYYNWNDAAWAAKTRTYRGIEYMMFNQRSWYYFPHAHFKILPKQTYLADHPDWYAASQAQICLSSQGAYDQFLHNLKDLIARSPDLVYIPLGGEDSPENCVCEACVEEQGKYGGVAGQTVRWINRMVADVVAWMEEEGMGDRELYFPMLAYYKTEEPPARRDGDTFVPIDPSCVLNDRSPIIFAPIAMDRAYSIMDKEHNVKFAENLTGWLECAKDVIFYLYCDSSYVAFEWYDAYHGMVENFKLAGELNSIYTLVDNEGMLKQARSFQALESYVFCKLMWNPYADVNQLTDEFIKHYYKEGAEYVSQYYYMMKTYYRAYADSYNELNPNKEISTISPNVSSYNRVFMEQLLSLLDKAHEAIDNADYTEAEKEIYHQRITIESFTQRYLLLENFVAEYSKETYLKMVDEFEADCNFCGIQQVNGRYPVCLSNEEQFAAWRKKVQ